MKKSNRFAGVGAGLLLIDLKNGSDYRAKCGLHEIDALYFLMLSCGIAVQLVEPRIICAPILSEMNQTQIGRLALGVFTQRLPN
jgi:hypothetical protein